MNLNLNLNFFIHNSLDTNQDYTLTIIKVFESKCFKY